jgi:hypothetical protein
VVAPDPPGWLAESQLDPLQSAALQQEVPGLAGAFDTQAMQVYMQETLVGARGPQVAIERCEVDQATYILGEGVTLRYLLTIADQSNGQPHEVIVSAQLFPSQAACAAYARERLIPLAAAAADRADLAWFAQPVATLDHLHMALHAFPIDGDLPMLLGATDRERLRAAFQAALPAAQARIMDVADCRVELVDYGRQHRCTLRYHVTGPSAGGGTFQQVVYGKLTGDGSGAMAESISRALQDRIVRLPAGAQFAVPQVYGWLPDLRLSLLEALSGQALIADMVKGRLRGKPEDPGAPSLEAAIATCGRIAATLHTSQIALGRRRTLEDELTALRQGAVHMQRISPELGLTVGRWLDRLAAAAAQTEPLPPCFNHGDYTHGQLLIDGANSGLIDFDSVCQAEPALDLGQFLTYVRLAGLKSKLSPSATQAALAELRAGFLAAYRDAGGAAGCDPARLEARVTLYRGVSLLRRVVRSWQKFKPGRVASALEIMEEELAAL